MLPSNMSPTSLPWASISGLPELPPTMSLLVERLKGVCGSSCARSASQLSGMRKGSSPVARSNRRASRVKGSISRPSSFQPCTVPKLRRSVKVASGEAGAVGAEAGAGDLLGGGLDGGLDLVLVALPHRAGFAVDAARELDHRVVRGVDP